MSKSLSLIDKKLKSNGVPPLTTWWQETLTRFTAHGARRFVGRVGRGGAKSHTAVKVALAEVLGRDWPVPPGERHYYAFVSQNKSEAFQRLTQLESWLAILGAPHTRSGDEIALRDLPLGFRVFAASVGAVSGFRCIGFSADEAAKWSNADHSANPAKEVIASLRAMTVTHPNALEWVISSPLAKVDYHFELFELGTTAEQFTAWAQSWVANPAITESDTRKLENDPRVHAREYGAIPQSAALAAFPPEHVERAFTVREPAFLPAQKVLILDPSSGGLVSRDNFTWAIASWCSDQLDPYKKLVHIWGGGIHRWPDGTPHLTFGGMRWKPRGAPYLAFHEVGAIQGGFSGQVTGDDIADQLAKIANAHNVTDVHSDQRESLFLSAAMERRGFNFFAHAWTNSSKSNAVQLVRRWLADGSLNLPSDCNAMKRELLSFEEVVNASGALTFTGRGKSKDDHVALLLTLAHAENSENALSSSPYSPTFEYGNPPDEMACLA